MANKPLRHGSPSAYNSGCRCDECTEYKRAKAAAYWVANKERINARNLAYYYANRDVMLEWQKAYGKANRDVGRRAMARWRVEHPDREHRILKREAESKVVTKRDWLRLCRRFGDRCCYCGTDAPLTQDHVIPLSRGGRHSIGNLLPACRSCNSSKKARLLVEWRHG